MSNMPLSRLAIEGAKKLQNRIKRFEDLYRKSGSLRHAWGLALRYTQHYRLTGDEGSLHNASHITQGICSIHYHFVEAYFLLIYLELEMGHAAKAQSMLEKLKPYRNNIKAQSAMTGAYQFCSAAMELKRGKARPARRHINALESYNNSQNDPWIDSLLCGFSLMARERASAAEYLAFAAKGSEDGSLDGSFLMVFAHELFVKESYYGDKTLAEFYLRFLRWGMAVGADLRTTVERNRNTVLEGLSADTELCLELYSVYPFDWLLKGICAFLIKNNDYSVKAYKYYREAENKQMDVDGLAEALLTAACKNEIEDVSRFSIDRYLINKSPALGPEGLYAYYLLLRRGQDEDIKHYRNDILQVGLYALETGSGKEFYMPTICKFIFSELYGSDPKFSRHVDMALNVLKESVFTYDVSAEARFAWVFEDEKEKSKIYELEGGKTTVTASGPDFKVFLFDDSMKNIPEAQVNVTPKLPEPGDPFLFKLYEAGFETEEMLIALSKYCSGLKGLTPDAADILKKTSGLSVSESFKTKISAQLGNYYASRNDYPAACVYFDRADENLLDPRSAENKLLVNVNAGKLEEAAAVVSKRSKTISDKALFYSLKKIAADKNLHGLIAPAAYDLTFRNWYDKQLVGIALENAQASAKEWQEFSRALSNLHAPNDTLDETILNNAIWMHRFDPGAQKVFTRFFERQPLSPYIMAFALYSAYECIINSAKPEYETLEILEKLALGPLFDLAGKSGGESGTENQDARFIYYGLCHIYAIHNVITFHSDEIFRRAMGFCETDGFIFPIFKEIKDKAQLTPYIEKNQPLVYRGGKGKKIVLYYKVEGGSGEYLMKNARYMRFGIYTACVPVFYGEKLLYHFTEEAASGSVETKEALCENSHMHLVENSGDLYYIINNAIIYESMFKYEAVEEIITNRLKEQPHVKGWLL